MTLSSLAITVAATTSTTLKKQSRNSKFSTLALFFVATSASSAARAFSSSTPTFLPRHHHQSLPRSGASTLNNSVIYSTRGGSLASIVGKKISLSRRFSSTQIEQEVVSEMDEVKAAASKISAADKLALMREKMEENGVDVYIIPSDDPHLSEYVPAAYMRRGYLTDFHGSAGTALVTKDAAYLWTDSRYFNEANLRLDAGHWTLMKQGQPKVPTIPKFLADLAISHYTANSKPLKVGMDAYVHAASFAKELNEVFADAAKDMEGDVPPTIAAIDTLDGKQNVVDSIWEGRPDLPKNPFRVHPMKYAGMTVQDKVTKIRSEMTEKKATMTVFSALDDIAYLFNVRCMGDVETCPIGIAYATISKDEVALHCDPEKVAPADVSEHLKEAGVTVKSYGDIVSDIESHLSAGKKNKVWLDNGRSNYALSRVIPEAALIDAQNPVTAMKGCKNEAEMEGMRQAHIVDGAAMANFMAWLENAIVVEGRSVSEVEIDEVLTGFRAKQPGFKEVSFPTIAGVGANGAIVHYRAAEGSDLLKYLDRTQPILIDSGGQYEYGTTDVTRTWHFAEKPDDEFREVYTRVLKGNIGVDSMIFPENTPGFVLDVFARKALWEIGKDYGHGTGHGVGAALNVHEGPHSISPRWGNKEVLKAGMVTSNEPGYYEDGNFGIRIENLLEIVEISSSDDATNGEANGEEPANKKQKVAAEGKKFLKFGKLTLIPIQKNLIKVEIMTEDELNWLDSYHQEVLQKVKPLLEEGTPAMEWLVKSCEPIKRD